MMISTVTGFSQKSMTNVSFGDKEKSSKKVSTSDAVKIAAAIAMLNPINSQTASADDVFSREDVQTTEVQYPRYHHHHHRPLVYPVPVPVYPVNPIYPNYQSTRPMSAEGMINRMGLSNYIQDPYDVGGVIYNNSDIKSKKYDKNTELYEVILRDGTMISYPQQNPLREGSPYKGQNRIPMVYFSEEYTVFGGLRDAKIVDTERDDSYLLSGCVKTYVEADYGKDQDNIVLQNRYMFNGITQRSQRNSVAVNEGDYINNVYFSDNAVYHD